MIPWEKFTTPQDAYEWAKTATSTHLLATCPKTGDHLVMAAIPTVGGIYWGMEARATRHGIFDRWLLNVRRIP